MRIRQLGIFYGVNLINSVLTICRLFRRFIRKYEDGGKLGSLNEKLRTLGTYSTHVEPIKLFKGRDHLVKLGVVGSIILK
jgi:hypothetical protein